MNDYAQLMDSVLEWWNEKLKGALIHANLNTSEFEVLRKLRKWQHSSGQDLARWIGLTPSAITRILDRLESRGFARRKRKGKVIEASLTSGGHKMYEIIQLEISSALDKELLLIPDALRTKMAECINEITNLRENIKQKDSKELEWPSNT